jgi:hypothetical protein
MIENTSEEKLFCVFHPDRETLLRCSRCNRPICTSCARQTPTGYRCKECINAQQKVFETALWTDYLVASVIAVILAFIGSLAASFIRFFVILIAPIFGFLISEAVRWGVRKRRSKWLFLVSASATVVGSLPLFLSPLLSFLSGLFIHANIGSITALLPLIWQGLYTFLVASTVYYRLSGIQMNR